MAGRAELAAGLKTIRLTGRGGVFLGVALVGLIVAYATGWPALLGVALFLFGAVVAAVCAVLVAPVALAIDRRLDPAIAEQRRPVRVRVSVRGQAPGALEWAEDLPRSVVVTGRGSKLTKPIDDIANGRQDPRRQQVVARCQGQTGPLRYRHVAIGSDTTINAISLPTNFERLQVDVANGASVLLGQNATMPFGLGHGGNGRERRLNKGVKHVVLLVKMREEPAGPAPDRTGYGQA